MAETHTNLSVDLGHRLGSLTLDVQFRTAAPWTVLFGPSGSGKSTVLRAIAGLIRPDSARVVVNPVQTILVDTAAGIFLPPHLRPVRWSGQTPALFPHRSVAANIAFSFASSAHLKDVPAKVRECLAHFGLESLAEAHPAELSGGQRQRVAVVRAASEARGKLLLLDEPFAGLDAEARDRLIADLRVWLGETPVISVTHDAGEAFLLGAEIVRMAEGRVLAQGPVASVLGAERERLKRALA